jgi:uncharacterized protein (DUF849 family)
LKPEICTLDLNTMTFGNEIVINTPPYVKAMAEIIYDSGVMPEFELFDSGDINLLNDFLLSGIFKGPPLASLVLGVKYGFAATPAAMMYGRGMLPPDAVWTGFGIGRAAFPMLAQAYVLGGHVRIGMEDVVRLSKTELVESNGQLVERAKRIIEDLGGRAVSASEAREMLRLSS